MTKAAKKIEYLDPKMLGLNCEWALTKLQQQANRKLKAGAIDIWFCPLSLPNNLEETAIELLNDHQLSRYEKRKKNHRAQAYLAARYFLYRLISIYSNTPLEQIKIDYTRLDKPFLSPNPSKLQFNFSDTGAFGVFAFAVDTALGVDVERLDRKVNFDAIANSRFNQSEQELLRQGMANDKVNGERLISAWTSKEAYGKNIGVGINFKMNQVSTYHGENCYHHEADRDMSILRLRAPQKHVISLAHGGSARKELKFFELSSL